MVQAMRLENKEEIIAYLAKEATSRDMVKKYFTEKKGGEFKPLLIIDMSLLSRTIEKICVDAKEKQAEMQGAIDGHSYSNDCYAAYQLLLELKEIQEA